MTRPKDKMTKLEAQAVVMRLERVFPGRVKSDQAEEWVKSPDLRRIYKREADAAIDHLMGSFSGFLDLTVVVNKALELRKVKRRELEQERDAEMQRAMKLTPKERIQNAAAGFCLFLSILDREVGTHPFDVEPDKAEQAYATIRSLPTPALKETIDDYTRSLERTDWVRCVFKDDKGKRIGGCGKWTKKGQPHCSRCMRDISELGLDLHRRVEMTKNVAGYREAFRRLA